MNAEEALELIRKLAPIAKEQGIKRVKVAGIDIEFGGGQPMDEKLMEKFFDKFMATEPTPEELLTFSAPGGPLTLEQLTEEAEATKPPFSKRPKLKMSTSQQPKHKV